MSGNGIVDGETYNKVKTILISQPKPERSPYYKLEQKYNLQIDWRPFIHVEGLTAKEFRKQKIRPDEYSSIIFTSKNSIDHFFRICDDMRIKMSQETKYFCISEAVANYLQKFIVYRKRKVFAGKRTIADLKNQLTKHKAKELFLMPISNLGAKRTTDFLNELELNWKDALMFRTVCSDLSDLSDVTYDVLVFFSPLGIDSLYENFSNFKQNNTRIAVYGNSTKKSVLDHGLDINIMAPAPGITSMAMALEAYLKKANTK